MDFPCTLEQMKHHKFFKRAAWQPNDGYITIMPGMALIWKFLSSPTPNAGVFMPTVEDLSATDWEELQDEAVFTRVDPPAIQ